MHAYLYTNTLVVSCQVLNMGPHGANVDILTIRLTTKGNPSLYSTPWYVPLLENLTRTHRHVAKVKDIEAHQIPIKLGMLEIKHRR